LANVKSKVCPKVYYKVFLGGLVHCLSFLWNSPNCSSHVIFIIFFFAPGMMTVCITYKNLYRYGPTNDTVASLILIFQRLVAAHVCNRYSNLWSQHLT
jgi:hypothetical protein